MYNMTRKIPVPRATFRLRYFYQFQRSEPWHSWHCSAWREVLGFDFPWIPWKFWTDFLATSPFRSPGVQSVCNRNEYQGISMGVKYGRHVELQHCCPSCAECQSKDGSPTFRPPAESPWLAVGKLYLFQFQKHRTGITQIRGRSERSGLFPSTPAETEHMYFVVTTKSAMECTHNLFSSILF